MIQVLTSWGSHEGQQPGLLEGLERGAAAPQPALASWVKVWVEPRYAQKMSGMPRCMADTTFRRTHKLVLFEGSRAPCHSASRAAGARSSDGRCVGGPKPNARPDPPPAAQHAAEAARSRPPCKARRAADRRSIRSRSHRYTVRNSPRTEPGRYQVLPQCGQRRRTIRRRVNIQHLSQLTYRLPCTVGASAGARGQGSRIKSLWWVNPLDNDALRVGNGCSPQRW